ncbi:MAG: GDSL-type esterase/lipase family protein [Planctomycetia bacterium]|nr:GDSL-type esterase/lipase family protein [Planctomycetia bacterium]
MKKMGLSLVFLAMILVVPGTSRVCAQETTDLPRTLVPAERLSESWWKDRHEANRSRIEQGNVDLLLIGDSITHGWDEAGAKVQEYYYGDRNYVNMGFGGDQTQHVLWRLDNAPMDRIQPKAAMLLIGINSLWSEWDHCSENTALGIKACVDKLRSLYPDIQILVLNVFDAREKADDPVRDRLNKTNSYLPGLFLEYENVTVLNINHLWVDGDGNIPKSLMEDFVHPGEEGYRLWGWEVEPYISEMLGVPAKEKMK